LTDSAIIQLLQNEINNTKSTIKQFQEQLKPIAPDCAVDAQNRMDTLANNKIVEQALSQQMKRLNQLSMVLKSVGTKEFGKCRKCGQTIPLGRIMIRPESLYCVRCAE
jgi:DnaK suppressor protein